VVWLIEGEGGALAPSIGQPPLTKSEIFSPQETQFQTSILIIKPGAQQNTNQNWTIYQQQYRFFCNILYAEQKDINY